MLFFFCLFVVVLLSLLIAGQLIDGFSRFARWNHSQFEAKNFNWRSAGRKSKNNNQQQQQKINRNENKRNKRKDQSNGKELWRRLKLGFPPTARPPASHSPSLPYETVAMVTPRFGNSWSRGCRTSPLPVDLFIRISSHLSFSFFFKHNRWPSFLLSFPILLRLLLLLLTGVMCNGPIIVFFQISDRKTQENKSEPR